MDRCVLQAQARAKGNNLAGKEAQFGWGEGMGRGPPEGDSFPRGNGARICYKRTGKDGWWEDGVEILVGFACSLLNRRQEEGTVEPG